MSDTINEYDRESLISYFKTIDIYRDEAVKIIANHLFLTPKKYKGDKKSYWNKKEVHAFMKRYLVSGFAGCKKTRIITGDAAAFIHFNSGRYWLIGKDLRTRLFHYSNF